ncbi:MAG TPA: glycosyl hydrolase, partial [Chloroflexi bacterium]|nr:glycosyl hydrolase [Chloroflexota bacterium]
MKRNHYNFNTLNPEIEKRIDNLLAKMTLEEKIGQTIQINIHEGNRKEMIERIRQGQVGSVLTIYGIDNINAVQKVAVEESRLGIPLLIGCDVIHGYRTIFPIPLAESCTWDLELIEESARIAAEEATANGVHWTFGPMVDICRDPRWGRIAEGAGEDPYLGQVVGAARVRGFQSELDNGHKMVACPKHYAAYGAAEAGKDYNTVDISERQLRDIYLPPFKAAFEAGAGTTMSAFNDLNGVPASANPLTLRQILRDEWNFKGLVVSDWNSVGELIPHGVAANHKEAARRAFLAGVDMDMTSGAYHKHLAELIHEGYIPTERLDEAVRQILRIKLMLGLFENTRIDPAGADAAILKPAYLQTALEAATQAMVLLKNQGNLLPIDTQNIKRIALIGPLADDHHEILGTWHRIGRDEDTESVLDGLRQVLPDDIELTYTQGCDIRGERPTNTISAVTAAQKADLVIMVLGEAEAMSGEAHSRAHLGLPGKQQFLLEAVHATGTPVVAVLMSGRPLVIPWMAENIPAILCAWHGGLRTGRAVADLLFGQANPSGKLTASWPRAEGQIPVYYAHKMTGRPPDGEGGFQFQKYHFTEYVDEEVAPLFPFGFGLSYTSFAYSNLGVLTPTVAADSTLKVTVKITNSGEIPAAEIVQLYVRDLVAEVTRPVRELKSFQKIRLLPGENQTLTFEIPVQTLGFHGLD